MEETFDRGNLSGHVYDLSGDMVKVRFSEASDHAGQTGTFRLVVRVDGSLAIDPSGLAVRRPQPASVREALPAGTDEIEEATVVGEIEAPKPMDPRVVDDDGVPSIGSMLQVQIGYDVTTIYVGEVKKATKDKVLIQFDVGLGLANGWHWELLSGENRIKTSDFDIQREDGPDEEEKMWGSPTPGADQG
jgi:hypothetical protein